jgi:hypothetical protein
MEEEVVKKYALEGEIRPVNHNSRMRMNARILKCINFNSKFSSIREGR